MRVSRARHIPADDKPEAPAGRLIGYARVSTAEQSLRLQEEALLKAGVHPENLHVEKVSGASKRRPALRAALLDARRGDTLIVWKCDRLGRQTLPLMQLVKGLSERGVAFRSLTESMIDTTTPMGQFMLGFFALFAEMERNLIRERTIAGVREAAARGVKFGQPERLSKAQKREARALYKSGVSVEKIAAKFKVSRQTIYKRAIGIKTRAAT